MYCSVLSFLLHESISESDSHEGESKILQYFSNLSLITAALDTIAKDMKVTNHTGFYATELAWCYENVNRRICLYGFEHGRWIPVFSLLYLAWSSKILQSEQNFLNCLTTVLWSTASPPFTQKIFLLPSQHCVPLSTRKALFVELLFVTHHLCCLQISQSKVMQNVSAHKRAPHHQP